MRNTVITLCVVLAGALCLAGETQAQESAELVKKLNSIIIPSIVLERANINDVAPQLTLDSRLYDKTKTGVEIKNLDRASEAEISLTLTNATLHDILIQVAQKTGLSLDLSGPAVILRKQE